MKPHNKNHLIKSSTAALLTAFICITAQIAVPTPAGVPVTLQTFAISLCGYLLGSKWGTASVITYLLLGAVGIPVFSSFGGGIQHLTSATGGFLTGFILLSLMCGFSAEKSKFKQILFGFSGLLLCHLCGIIQLSAVSGTGVFEAFVIGSLPFILKDIICVFLGMYLANTAKRKITKL